MCHFSQLLTLFMNALFTPHILSVKPLSLQMGSPRNTPTTIICSGYRVHTTSYRVHTASKRRSHRVVIASMRQVILAACSQRFHGALTARTRHTHRCLTALITFYLFVFSRTYSYLFGLFEAFRYSI